MLTSPLITPSRYCRRCGYNLQLLSTPRCPECGHPFDPGNPKTFRRRPLRRWLPHVKRATYALLTLTLLLAAVWGWFFWDWYGEHDALRTLHATSPSSSSSSPLSPFLREHLGAAGFVLDRVTELYLDSHSDLVDLAPVARFTRLRAIDLRSTSARDLRPLRRLTGLQGLNLSETPVDDLSPLSHLAELRTLVLGRRVRDLTPLSDLSELRLLNLNNAPVQDLTALEGLSNLEELRLIRTQVKDLSPLIGLKRLRILYLVDTPVDNFAPLKGLTSLHELSLPKATASELQVELLHRALPQCEITVD